MPSVDGTDALHYAPDRVVDLQAWRAYVEVEVAVEATEGVRRQAVRCPEGGSGVAGGADDSVLDRRPVAVLHIRDARAGRDERCGELRDVVYDNVRRPPLDDLE